LAGLAVVLLAGSAAAFWLTRPSSPPPQAAPAPRVAQQQSAPPPAAMDPARLESDLWDSVKDSGNAAALNSYLAKYPDGLFAAAAKAKLAALNNPAPVRTVRAAPAAPAPIETASATPQTEEASTQPAVSSPSPAHPPMGAALNPQVQQAVGMARQSEKRARAVAEKAEAMAGQGRQPGRGFAGPRAARPGGRMMAEHYAGLDVIAYPEGDHYAGGTRDGKRFGLGVLTGASNHVYRERVGQYVADLLSGYAVVYRRDGKVRIGQWKDGLMSGYGALLDANGRVLEQGLYANDKLATPMKGN
jgi:hypothetical protein